MSFPRPKPFLSSYRNLVFVETGSHHGDGIQAALDAGFKCIHSVDISPFDFGWCSHRFEKFQTKVHLNLGDSRTFLRDLLPTVTTRCTFWLDAHECGTGATEFEDCPLLEELQIIFKHPPLEPRQYHTILIDDVRLFGVELPAEDEIRKALLNINPHYKLGYVNSAEFDDDILVATPQHI